MKGCIHRSPLHATNALHCNLSEYFRARRKCARPPHCVRMKEMRHIFFARKLTDSNQIVQLGECAHRRRCSRYCFRCVFTAHAFRAQTNGQMCFVRFVLLFYWFSFVFSILFCLHCRCALYAFVLPHDFACTTKCTFIMCRTSASSRLHISQNIEIHNARIVKVLHDSRNDNGG